MNILKHLYIIVLLYITIDIHAQTPYFINPMDSPMYVSGNFCQLRDGHFHYGLDIPTNDEIGWPVYAVADGYISRVFTAHYGYGNAIFIAHPNGLTTVYAHLSKYNPVIEQFLLKQHYIKKQNNLDLFPKKNQLPVKKGQIIAWSGNSGGSSGPHLHFEIRNGKNELLNPQFYYQIPDTFPPTIESIYIKDQFGRELASIQDTFIAHDSILFLSALLYDRAIFPSNKLAPKKYILRIDEQNIFTCAFDKYTFAENKYISLHMDADRYWNDGIKCHHLYADPRNTIGFYKNRIYGLNLSMGMHTGEIIVEDFYGRITTKKFFVRTAITNQKIVEGNTYMNEATTYFNIDSTVSLYLPKKTFIDTCATRIYIEENKVFQERSRIPSFQSFFYGGNLSMKIPDYISKEQYLLAYIGYQTNDTTFLYCGGKISGNRISTNISLPGTYKILIDNLPPEVSDDGLVADSSISFHIKDSQSGIFSYNLKINGKWARAQFDSKSGTVNHCKDIYSDYSLPMTIQLTVTDKKGNILQRSINLQKGF